MVGPPDEPKGQKTVLKPHLFLWQQLDWCEIFLVKFFNRSRLSVLNKHHFRSQTYSIGLKKKTFGLFKTYFVYFPQYFHMNIISSPLSIWPKCDIKQHLHLFWWFESPKFISIKKIKKYFFKKFSKTSKNMSKMTVN